MSTSARAALSPARTRPRTAIRWSGAAWGAIGLSAGFIALTCWWLTQDRSIPIYDAGYHLKTAIVFHGMLSSGDLLGPFNQGHTQYPPLVQLVGALAIFVAGVHVATPIMAENLVFVPLLALGCYQTGRLLFGARAGLLAVIFALGSPLFIVQFHVFMLDAPEAALVAVSMWLMLASDDFSRRRIAGLAGLAVGAGMLVKAGFPLYLAGIALVALARGGWRNWRGIAIFAVVALAVAAPWYLRHVGEFSTFTRLANENTGVAGNHPRTLSARNFLWYFWSTLNWGLLAPLFLLALGGMLWMIRGLVRWDEARGPRLELLVGGFVAWLGITLAAHHDIRYGMPLMPYLAVIGTGWIVHLARPAALATTAVLVLAVAANTLGSTFGVGGKVELASAHARHTEQSPDRIVFYSNEGPFHVAGPKRDGDVLGLLRALRRNGVRRVIWGPGETYEIGWSSEGLDALSIIAGLQPFPSSTDPRYLISTEVPISLTADPRAAALVAAIAPKVPATCTRLTDGTGVWVLRANASTGRVEHYCPFRRPEFYR